MDQEWIFQILEQLDEGIHVIDINGKTIFYNKAMGRMEGLKPDDVLGQSLLSHFPTLSKETSTLWQVLESGKPILQNSQTYLNPKGERITSVNDSFPLFIKEKVAGAFEVARDWSNVARLTEQVAELQSELQKPLKKLKRSSKYYTFQDIHTKDPHMNKALRKAKRAAGTDVNMLISGETGTGKEMAAQGIHSASRRAKGPFIAQNCAALPENLLESILFGTVKGSFTGALDKPGLFEQAQGGTVLLDELDSMGLNLQAKLLRVLQEGKVRRLGDTTEQDIDVRFLATTNRTPDMVLKEGRIRPDLFYRLNVVDIYLPPLRERTLDIDFLTKFFLNEFSKKLKRQVPVLDPIVLNMFQEHKWPGNVRELAHVIEGGLVVAGKEFKQEDLPTYFRNQLKAEKDSGVKAKDRLTLPEMVEQLEKQQISAALNQSKGNLTHAAKRLGISRQLLQYKLRKWSESTEPYSQMDRRKKQ